MQSLMYSLLEWSKSIIRNVNYFINSGLYYGKEKYCPLCERYARKFKSYGLIPRQDAQCPHCGSLERHRLLWLFLQQRTNLLKNQSLKMLHLAPELCLELVLRNKLGNNYLTADLFHRRASVKMDITDIQYPDHSFDVIYCSHVLEHVTDDRKAMNEFYRVLKDDGWAILNVPIYGDQTLEDPSIKNPRERLKVFGQEDHVRIYGSDYVNRLQQASFSVEVIKVDDLVTLSDAVRMGLTSETGDIFFCTKLVT
jgi:SAM-dependent methyltransferase